MNATPTMCIRRCVECGRTWATETMGTPVAACPFCTVAQLQRVRQQRLDDARDVGGAPRVDADGEPVSPGVRGFVHEKHWKAERVRADEAVAKLAAAYETLNEWAGQEEDEDRALAFVAAMRLVEPDTPGEFVRVTVREDGDLHVHITTFHKGGEIVTKARTLPRLLNLKSGGEFLLVPVKP